MYVDGAGAGAPSAGAPSSGAAPLPEPTLEPELGFSASSIAPGRGVPGAAPGAWAYEPSVSGGWREM